MKLSFNMICEQMLRYLGVNAIWQQINNDSISVSGIGYAEDAQSSDELIYLIDSRETSYFPTKCIIIGEEDILPCVPSKTSALLLPRELSKLKVANALSMSFSFYTNWKDKLIDAVSAGCDWYTLLDYVHDITQNPMIIYDSSMKVLAYTRNDGSDDAIWRDTVSAGMASTANMHESEELLKYVHLFETQNRPFKYQGEAMSEPFYSCNVLVHDKRVGMVTLMERNHKITPGEIELLELFATIVALKMQLHSADTNSREDNYRDLLLDLLQGRIHSTERLNTRLIAAGWHAEKHFVVMQFSRSLSYITGTQWKLALDAFGKMGLDGICCMLNEPSPVICAISSFKDLGQVQSLREKLTKYCLDNRLRCGMSDIFEDLIQVPRYWDEAVSALELGNDTLNEYSAVREKKLFTAIREQDFVEDLLSPAVLALKELDDKEQTEYCKTLHTLCRAGFRLSDAAEKLGIHRTTLNYRLQKITELTGFDLNNADLLLHAWISLEILSRSI